MSHRVVSSEPAFPGEWSNHFLLGNGRIGASVSGNPQVEHFYLNEETVWCRNLQDRHNPEAIEARPKVCALLRQGRVREAQRIAEESMMALPSRIEPYQYLANLMMSFDMPAGQEATNYTRSLDLSTGLVNVRYDLPDGSHEREIFVSYPDQCLVMHIAQPGAQPLRSWMEFHRPHDYTARPLDERTLLLEGRAGRHGTFFVGTLRAITNDGSVRVNGTRMILEDVSSLTLIMTVETDYWESFRGHVFDEPFEQRCLTRLNDATTRTYENLRERHVNDHRALYERAELKVDALCDEEHTVGDPPNAVTQFNVSRYITIASSRTGGLPSNLQGIWTNTLSPPWNSDYHTNINIQMNYWPSEPTNLGDLQRPFLDWLTFIAKSGSETAKRHYGCRGWVLHHISDPWGFTLPGDAAPNGLWPMGGAWCALHAWEHYQFNGDRNWLASQGYPLLRDAARFFEDYLFEGEDGLLVSGPSTSPENTYRTATGEVAKLCLSSTMDHQIIRALMQSTISAARILGLDEASCQQWELILSKLVPTRIAKNGTILEWSEDYEEVAPGHRHMSHLFGLYPGTELTLAKTPALVEAAEKTIERRIAYQKEGGEAGWSFAWKGCFYARLRKGDEALDVLEKSAERCTQPNLMGRAHHVMQLDNVFGAGAAVAEMLIQSHEHDAQARRVIRLLPALPDAWSQGGEVRGWKSRGGHEVSMRWQDGKLERVELTLGFEDCAVVIGPDFEHMIEGPPGDQVRLK